jgi:acetylornithine deacetylase/succinyl-diaminopimelate desuccinylase-like protein
VSAAAPHPLREATLALLREWTPHRSFAGNETGLRTMAGAVTAWLRERLGATIVADGQRLSPPVVHARIDAGAPTTLILYNMYDVMPAPAAGWSVDPFVGGILETRNGPGFVARGAENNKGPLCGMLGAVEHLLKQGGLGANLEILIEGQEETGSGELRRYLGPGTPVRPAASALFPSFCEYGGGPPRVYFGFKGIAYGTVRVAGGAWGGPRAAIHASNAPWIANPAARLATALSTALAEPVAGIEMPADMAPVLDRLAAGFDPPAELAFRASERYSVAGSPRDLIAHVLTAGAFSISALATEPPDGRAVIPSAATARFELRLPPGIDPAAEIAALERRIAAGSQGAAAVAIEDAYPGCRFDPADPGYAALIDTYRGLGAEPRLWPWAIGAAPAYAFAGVARSFVIGGLGTGGNAHGIDEFVTLAGLDRYLASLLAWLPALAHAAAPRAHPSAPTAQVSA